MNRFFALSLFAVACVATPPDDGTPEPGDDPAASGCAAVSEQALGADEESPAGFSAAVALEAALGAHSVAVAWADGAGGVLELEVTQAGAPAWVDYEVLPDGSGAMIEIGCLDALEVPVQLLATSDDGRVALDVSARLLADADGGSVWVDVSDDVDLAPFVPAGATYDDVRGFLSLRFDAAGVTGSLDGQGSGSNGNTAYAESFAVATLGR